jgi:hypothetical protein
MLELSEIREQLRIDAVETSDSLLTRYLGAAIRRFESKTNRKLFKEPPADAADFPGNGLLLDDDIALALLLVIGHWNINREDSSDLRLACIPQGFEELANPYRWWPD